MNRRTLILSGAAALAAGCGGGSTSRKPGRAVFTIAWPEKTTRLIPQASQSVVIEVRQGTTVLDRKVLARPATTATFDNLPEGDLTAVATAHPSTDGTGVAQALGVAPLAIRDGETTQIPLTMASTIVGFTMAFSTLGVGETRRLIGTFRDAQNAVVLVSPEQIEYSVTSNPGAISFDAPNRLATGVAPGQVQLQVRNLETGATYSTVFQIVNTSTLPDVIQHFLPGHLVVPDPFRYLLWIQKIGENRTITAIDPHTGIAVRRITLNIDARIVCLSNSGNNLFLDRLEGYNGYILDISTGQVLPGIIQVPGSNTRVLCALNTSLSNDSSCLVLSSGTGIGTERISIFDGFTKRPGSIQVTYVTPHTLSDSGRNYYSTLLGDGTNYYVTQCPISASGISGSVNSSEINRGVVAVSDSVVMSYDMKLYNANGFAFLRDMAPMPHGTGATLSLMEGSVVHTLTQVIDYTTHNCDSYYARHDINTGALVEFFELPKGGVAGTPSAALDYGYRQFYLFRNYLLLRSVMGFWNLKKRL